MNLPTPTIKGYYEIGLTYINHRIKVRVFNGESFDDLLSRMFFILSMKRDKRLYALKEASNKLICNIDQLVQETFYQLVIVDTEKDKPLVAPFQTQATENELEEPGSTRSKKGTSEARNRTYHGFSLTQ